MKENELEFKVEKKDILSEILKKKIFKTILSIFKI